MHTLLTSNSRGLESLQDSLLATLVNIAPHLQNLQRATSSMIVNLLASRAGPEFLLANDGNHRQLRELVEVVRAILEHQFEGV